MAGDTCVLASAQDGATTSNAASNANDGPRRGSAVEPVELKAEAVAAEAQRAAAHSAEQAQRNTPVIGPKSSEDLARTAAFASGSAAGALVKQPRASGTGNPQPWLSAVAQQTQAQVRQHVAQASDQLGHSLRQLYASASSLAAEVPAAEQQPPPPPPLYQNLPGVVPYYQGRSVGPPPSYDDVVNPFALPPTYQSLFGQMREARKSSRGLLDLLRRLLIILASTLGCTLLIAFMILIPFTMIIVGAVYIDECKIEHIPAFLLVGGLVWASKNILHCYTQCRKQSAAEQQLAAAEQLYALQLAGGSSRSSSLSSSLDLSPERQRRSSAASAAAAATTTTTTTTTTNPAETQLHDELQAVGTRQVARGARHLAARQRTSGAHNNNNQAARRLKSSICESLLNCVLFGWFVAGCIIVFRNYEPNFENTSSARYCNRTVYMYTFWLITSALLLFGLFIGSICCLMVSSLVASSQDELDMA